MSNQLYSFKWDFLLSNNYRFSKGVLLIFSPLLKLLQLNVHWNKKLIKGMIHIVISQKRTSYSVPFKNRFYFIFFWKRNKTDISVYCFDFRLSFVD